MNVLISDYDKERLPACDPEEKKDEMLDFYNENLYRNVEDLFERKNSERQFYTLPTTTIPNDQTAFAKWLYGTPKTCKYDGINCLKYEDIRYH